jgi:hypothetical protein
MVRTSKCNFRGGSKILPPQFFVAPDKLPCHTPPPKSSSGSNTVTMKPALPALTRQASQAERLLGIGGVLPKNPGRIYLRIISIV